MRGGGTASAARAATAPPCRLRPATDADRDFLLAVYASTRAEELATTDWTEELKTAFVRQQFEAQDLHYRKHYEGAEYSVVEIDGRPVGRLYVVRWTREIRLMDIAFLPEERGRGVGGALVRDLLAEGEASGKTVTIHVEIYNPALRFYERLGFRPVSEYGVYRLMEWRPSGLAQAAS